MSTVTNFLVSNLPSYVQTNRDMIIKNFALPNLGTRARIGLMTGVKGSAYMNYLDLTPSIQDGSGCAFNPLDSITLTQRTMTVAAMKVDGQICPETLLGKYAEYLVRINAVENDLPFEQYIIDALVAELNKKIETVIWQGKTVAHSGSDLIDGFIYKFDNDASVVDESIASGKTAYEGIRAVYLKMTEETLERGGVIFVSPAIFRAFMQEMVILNFYHYSAGNDYPQEFLLPGSDCKVIRTYGLSSSLKIVGTFADNLVYGTDMEGDEEDIDLWWSQDDRLFKYQVKWASGVQYHFPAQVVLGTFAAAPSVPSSNNAYLSNIATNTTPSE